MPSQERVSRDQSLSKPEVPMMDPFFAVSRETLARDPPNGIDEENAPE